MTHSSNGPVARILVIEDNDSDVFLLERALKKQDIRFELVHRRTERQHSLLSAGRGTGPRPLFRI